MRGKYFNSLNEVQGILDHFEFFERLQIIVNRNTIFWCLTMPKKRSFQYAIKCLYMLLVIRLRLVVVATFQDMLKFEN